MFYGLLTMVLAGSVSFTEMKSSKAVDVLTVSSSVNSGENAIATESAEKREEGYEAQESAAEVSP